VFLVPSGQVVAAWSIDASCELIQLIDLLGDCCLSDAAILRPERPPKIW
jgi:hypothetical protein